MGGQKSRLLSWVIVLTASFTPLLVATANSPLRDFYRVSPVSAQGPQSERNLVTLSVVVRDKQGRFVTDLSKEQFRVFEGDKQQDIVSFSTGAPRPMAFGLLMDWSGSRRGIPSSPQGTLPHAEIEPAARFFGSLLDKDHIAFAAKFSQNVEPLGDFTSDPIEIERSIRSATSIAPYGPTALYDAIIWACQKLSSKPGYKALVVVAEGDDNTSKHSSHEAIEAALRTGTAIYFISLANASPYLHGHSRGHAIETAKELSGEAGGEAMFARHPEDIAAAFVRLTENLRSVYVLAYHPSETVRGGKFRKVKIETTRNDVQVLTRKGYYAPKN